MSHIVISSFENVETGDLQAQGEAISVFETEASAKAHFIERQKALEESLRKVRAADADATFVSWLLLLRMPLEVSDVEEALEDLELVIEETDSVDDPFGELVVAYEGARHTPAGAVDYPKKEALRMLEAWLT